MTYPSRFIVVGQPAKSIGNNVASLGIIIQLWLAEIHVKYYSIAPKILNLLLQVFFIKKLIWFLSV